MSSGNIDELSISVGPVPDAVGQLLASGSFVPALTPVQLEDARSRFLSAIKYEHARSRPRTRGTQKAG